MAQLPSAPVTQLRGSALASVCGLASPGDGSARFCGCCDGANSLTCWPETACWTPPACAARVALTTTGTSRSEEHTSELQSLMRISYAVFCLKKKKTHTNISESHITL